MEIPIVSICCITYNQEKYIRETIEGFLLQKTTFLIEVLIYDDASTDKTAHIIKEYENKYPEIIKPIYQNENKYSKGVPISFTYNFPRVRGKYIALCEGDDYWIDPMKLQKQVDFLEKNEDYGLVGTSTKIHIEKKEKYKNNKLKETDFSFEDFVLGNRISTLTSCFRTDLLMEYHKNIKPYERGWYLGDYPIWIYMSKRMKVKNMPDITAVYRKREESMSNTNNLDKQLFIEKQKHLIRNFYKNYFDLSPDLRSKIDVVSYREAEIIAVKLKDCKYCEEILNSYIKNRYLGLAFFLKIYLKYPNLLNVFYFVERLLIKLNIVKHVKLYQYLYD